MPLSDNGPHIAHGWAQVVRLRHLYATRPGMHLLISEGGQIRGSAVQTLHSKWNTLKRRVKRLQKGAFVTNRSVGNISILGLMEIRPVGPGRVAIRGVATARFLCIEDDGTLYSSVSITIILTKGEEYMFLFRSLIKTRDTKFFPKSHKKD